MIKLDKTKKYAVVGHPMPDFDSLCGSYLAQKYFSFLGYECTAALPSAPDAHAAQVLLKAGIDVSGWSLPDVKCELILVDCHETPLTNKVAACIDHHPTGADYSYGYYENKNASSASKLVFDHMVNDGCPADRTDVYLTVLSIYFDTQSLASSKFVPSDKKFIDDAVESFGFDPKQLYIDGLCLNDLSLDIKALAYNGFKEYTFGRIRAASSYLQSDSYTDCFTASLIEYIKSERVASGYDLWILLLHNPIEKYSVEYDITDSVTEKRFNFLASRGKDVIPAAEKKYMLD